MSTSNDIRDILEIQKSAPSSEPPAKVKPLRYEKEKRPDGISRELFQLIGGPPPVAFTKPAFKAKPNLRKKAAHWEWRPFHNLARSADDDLELNHWVKANEDRDQAYRFNEFNKAISILDYTEEEYEKHLIDREWSKEETDYLFNLCQRYDLRFLVITDRYSWPDKNRTIEEIKDRYYNVCRKITQARPSSPTSNVNKDAIIAQFKYDKSKEEERKNHLCYLFTRTPEQIRDEETLVQEYERIEQNEKKFAKERENILKMLNFQDIIPPNPPKRKKSLLNGPSTPTTTTEASGSFFPTSPIDTTANKKNRRSSASSVGSSALVEVASPTDAFPANTQKREKLPPGVIVRSQKIPPVKQSAITKVTKYLQECRLNVRPTMATETVCAKWAELQKAIVNMLELKRHVEKLENDLEVKRRLLAKAKFTVLPPATPSSSLATASGSVSSSTPASTSSRVALTPTPTSTEKIKTETAVFDISIGGGTATTNASQSNVNSVNGPDNASDSYGIKRVIAYPGTPNRDPKRRK